MAHVPESVQMYVCDNCQATYAGTPIKVAMGQHDFEPPSDCGTCTDATFVQLSDWIRHHA